MTRDDSPRVIVAGFGSADRGDDGVGPLVAAHAAAISSAARDVGPLSEPLDLLDYCDGVDLVVVVDAVRSNAKPGTVRVVEMNVEAKVDDGEVDTLVEGVTSTHGIGLAGVLRLARAVGRAPSRLVVVGVEGEEFALGHELSPSVRAALPEAVRLVLQLIAEVNVCA